MKQQSRDLPEGMDGQGRGFSGKIKIMVTCQSKFYFSTLPAGMETTVKIKVGETILSSVVFGAIDYETDAPIRFSISGSGILLFDRESGENISIGRLVIRK